MGTTTSKAHKGDIQYLTEDKTHSFKECLPLEHSIGQSPFKHFERIGELGTGSMGAVMRVEKKVAFLKPKEGKKKRRTSFTAVRLPSPNSAGNPSPTSGRRHSFSSVFGTSSAGVDMRFEGRVQTQFAMKRIILEKLSDEYRDELRNEIAILRDLDHPNIIRLYEIYDVKSQIYVVMELCSGGNLWQRVPYKEEDAAKIVKKVVSAVTFMHEDGICHRDLKMENILFENDSPNAEIKIIDYGLSKKYSPGEQMTSRVGSYYTMAPQVLEGIYTSQADMWAVGVLAYILLSDKKPFEAPENDDIVEKIMKCDYNFDDPLWKTISEEAKEFISNLIELDPEVRLTAKKANESKWLQMQVQSSLLDREFVDNLFESIDYQSECSLMKKIGLLIIAHNSSPNNIVQLRLAFQELDKNNDGIITFDDFKQAIEKFVHDESEIKNLYQKLDVYGKGSVYYTEFLAATLEMDGKIEVERLADAFNRIDIDHTGYISKDNIKQILGVDYDQVLAEKAIKEFDSDQDGKISFAEFKKTFSPQRENEKNGDVYNVQYDNKDNECVLDKEGRANGRNDNNIFEYSEKPIELQLK